MGAFLDDGFYDHPKHMRVSNDATALWARALGYCSRHMTDGLVSEDAARSLARVRAPARVILELISVGLWSRVDGGYKVHDFLQWNKSKAERMAALESAKSRKRKWNEERQRRLEDASGTHPERVPNGSVARPRNALPSPARPSPARPSPDLPTGDLRADPSPDAPSSSGASSAEDAPRPRSRVAKAKPPGSSKPAPHPRFAEVVAAYSEAFEGARGQKPLLGAREGGDVNRLLARFAGDADRAIACIRAAYVDEWKARNATIATIAADPSKYLGADTVPPDGRRPIQELSDAWGPKSVAEANLPPRAAGDPLGF